jgi:hypothetical protein
MASSYSDLLQESQRSFEHSRHLTEQSRVLGEVSRELLEFSWQLIGTSRHCILMSQEHIAHSRRLLARPSELEQTLIGDSELSTVSSPSDDNHVVQLRRAPTT